MCTSLETDENFKDGRSGAWHFLLGDRLSFSRGVAPVTDFFQICFALWVVIDFMHHIQIRLWDQKARTKYVRLVDAYCFSLGSFLLLSDRMIAGVVQFGETECGNAKVPRSARTPR